MPAVLINSCPPLNKELCIYCRNPHSSSPHLQNNDAVTWKWGFVEGPPGGEPKALQEVYTNQIMIIDKDSEAPFAQTLRDSPICTHVSGQFLEALLLTLKDGICDGRQIQVGWHKTPKYTTIALQCLRCRFLCAAEIYLGRAGGTVFNQAHAYKVQCLLAYFLGITPPGYSGV